MSKYLSFLLLFSLIFFGCSDSRNTMKAAFMKDCFTTEEISLMNEAILVFEDIYVGSKEGLGQKDIYYKFIWDFNNIVMIPPAIFLNSKSKNIIQKIKNSTLFSKIWTNKKRSNRTYYEKHYEEMVASKQPYVKSNKTPYYYLDPDGIFLNCLIKHSKNEKFSALLKAIKTEPEISPDLFVGGMHRDFDRSLYDEAPVQTLIVFYVYYTFVLNIDEDLKKRNN